MRRKSKKPSKQRLYEHETPKNEAHKLMSAPLSKKLRTEHGYRTLPVREGDSIIIVRGEYKGKKGKISKTDPVKHRIFVDGIGGKKTDAQEIAIPLHPSNVIIEKINSKDRYRRDNIVKRRIPDDTKKEEIISLLEKEAAAEIEAEEDLIEFEDDELTEDEELLMEDEDFDLDDDMMDDEDDEEEDN